MLRFSLGHRLYLFLVCAFVTSLLVADIVAGKFFVADMSLLGVWPIGRLEMSVGTVAFPVAFLLTDIVNEYYGRDGARLMTGLGMAMLLLAFGIITLARFLPISEHSPIPQDAFDSVFGLSLRLFVSSLVAYLISQLIDIYAFHAMKTVTRSKHLWLRAIGSTALSQVVDTVVVNFGALLWTYPVPAIVEIIIASYLYKLVVATLLTPLCYLAHDLITVRLGIEPAPIDARALAVPEIE